MSPSVFALAERLGALKECEACCGRGRLVRLIDDLVPAARTCPVCRDGLRLPTEAEVRAAIREAGQFWIEVGVRSDRSAGVMFGGDERYRVTAEAGVAEPDELVLYALLLALEAARG